MGIKRKTVTIITGALLLIGVGASDAVAGGAGGGNFKCSITGIPNWGYVTSQYNHPDVRHYATARGKGGATTYGDPGVNAVATVGRSFNTNACYWGKS